MDIELSATAIGGYAPSFCRSLTANPPFFILDFPFSVSLSASMSLS